MNVEERVRAETEAAKAALLAILPRVSALNSFIRSEAYRRWHSSLPKIVYHYKREALKRATNLGIAEHRRAEIPAKCRDCGGSGRYEDSWGFTHDHCWKCQSTGHVRLLFVETTLPGMVWLSPREKVWSFTIPYDQLAPTENNPQINQPGKDLTPSEVAAHLNAIEAFFPERPPAEWGDYGRFDIANTYTIWVGRTREDQCHLCKTPIERPYGGHGVTTGRVAWSAQVCRQCGDRKDVFETLRYTLPLELVTPEIAEWIDRHPPAPEDRERSGRVVEVSYYEPAAEPATAAQTDGDEDIPF